MPTRSAVERDRLIELHLHLVPPIARRVKRKVPPSFDLEDLIAEGNIGLMQAASRYKPNAHGGTPFSKFAQLRIYGAILDSVRRRCWIENTHCPLDDAAEPSHQPALPFLIAGTQAIAPRRGVGRAHSPFPRSRVPRRLYLALRRLTVRQRAVLGSIYNDGASYKHAAAIFHCRPEDIAADHQRALDTLRAALLQNVSILPSTLVFFPAVETERAA